jgi:hypothetical protein
MMTLDRYGHLFVDNLDDVTDKTDDRNVPTKGDLEGKNAP